MIFYGVLAALVAICFWGFFQTLDPRIPRWQLERSIIGTNPGKISINCLKELLVDMDFYFLYINNARWNMISFNHFKISKISYQLIFSLSVISKILKYSLWVFTKLCQFVTCFWKVSTFKSSWFFFTLQYFFLTILK